ncbi:unnamed protein product [Acanthoscelides obtectus]|uniref:Uncharacterized protein n=1 Tax=Acanthoscelides obtectus TaxID=200917 RepID=A0A9P0M2W8_ACAOB|nr:unnamed protein product [Acanthoscelides obtectus]CAK1656976.1 hypothetical protein AOBTE_LOCUS20053 [Acanthoscelides obtectus]
MIVEQWYLWQIWHYLTIIFRKFSVFLNIKINHSGAVSVGANESITLAESSTSAISDTLAPSSAKEITIPAKKIKMSHLPETEEPKIINC